MSINQMSRDVLNQIFFCKHTEILKSHKVRRAGHPIARCNPLSDITLKKLDFCLYDEKYASGLKFDISPLLC